MGWKTEFEKCLMDHVDKRHTLKGKKGPILLIQASYFLKAHGVISMYFKAGHSDGLVIRYNLLSSSLIM